MKLFNISLILILVLVGTIYYQCDKRLFYYGKNDLHLYHTIPFHIKPECRPLWEGGFVLRDQYGFTIAGNGNTYPVGDKKILINKVLNYGFNAENLVAEVKDSNENRYSVNIVKNQNDSGGIIVTMKAKDNLNKLAFDKYIIIEGNDKIISRLEIFRNILRFLFIIILIIFIYFAVRNNLRKERNGMEKNGDVDPPFLE